MGRLRRFDHHRFIGLRDEMRVYDCDDEGQFAAVQRRVDEGDLMARSLVATFSPDTLTEARNRGFRAP
jgi:hypothetical protein